MPGEMPKVKAECWSDDYAVHIHFDASRWLAQSSKEELQELVECGWRGDYAADKVAEFFRGSTTKDLFDYLSTEPTMSYTNDTVGFECSVDPETTYEWLVWAIAFMNESINLKKD